MAEKKDTSTPTARNWVLIILILLSLWIGSAILANFVEIFTIGGDFENLKGNVAVIPVKGLITSEPASGAFSAEASSSSEIIKLLEKAKDSDAMKAVVLEINSPGGSAVASEEVASAVKELNKTTVAWIREVGASGAYWIASSSDHVVANRMSATGSIGVLSSYLEFGGLLDRFNITYERLVSGKYKDMGSPYRELTNEERRIIEERLETVHEFFIQSVAENRNLSESQVRELASGIVYLGAEAAEFGLVDELGGKKEAMRYIENKLNITAVPVTYARQKTLLDVFAGLFSRHGYYAGLGMRDSEGLFIRT